MEEVAEAVESKACSPGMGRHCWDGGLDSAEGLLVSRMGIDCSVEGKEWCQIEKAVEVEKNSYAANWYRDSRSCCERKDVVGD